MTRTEKQTRIVELNAELDDVKTAIKNILTGKKQSYGIGTRNAAAYNMTIGELKSYREKLEREIADLEADVSGKSRRCSIRFVPRY